jgi:hypothetical protein
MAHQTAQQTRLIGERVRALAIILLTRREDVSILEVTEELGLDFIVTLNHEEKPGLRQFGVKLAGAWTKVTAEHANAVLYPTMQKILRYGPFPYPVVLFFFTMQNGEGWYTWATEPRLTKDGGFELRANEEASCHPLDDDAVDEIIRRVDAWHDAFFARTIKETPKRGRK